MFENAHLLHPLSKFDRRLRERLESQQEFSANRHYPNDMIVLIRKVLIVRMRNGRARKAKRVIIRIGQHFHDTWLIKQLLVSYSVSDTCDLQFSVSHEEFDTIINRICREERLIAPDVNNHFRCEVGEDLRSRSRPIGS